MKKGFILIVSIGLFYACGTTKKQSTDVETENIETVQETATVEEEDVVAADEVIERPQYNAAATILTDLIHTKLAVSFDWYNSQMKGTETLTARPYFYPTDSLILDAQEMKILSVSMNGKPLDYEYIEDKTLRIQLDKIYTRNDEYTVVIEYIARPERIAETGSSAITSHKGLFFINPRGENEDQMPHIWTQGETESSSVWFPTIDRPNQKTTQEIYMTVDDKYTTLSNGSLVESTENKDGTRTDHWVMEKEHAPYLFMMAVGEFAVVKETYTKNDGTKIPVTYYVEPEWEKYAHAIFGETPKMMEYFSELLGVEYPWSKYAQIVVREFVSGAMENTTASVFGDFVYQNKRELLDKNYQAIIAHELFHHWFGNLVTLESWSNLPLNESFANYSQYLWDEYHWGEDEADYQAEEEAEGYFQSAKVKGYHPMIWYQYESQEQMFDATSYNRGGRVLHLLRTYIGDEAFFAALELYLKRFAYKTTELANLRLVFEEVTGEDLNWFFKQWFFEPGYPTLNVTQSITDSTITITIEQTQDFENFTLYKIPLNLALYVDGSKTIHPIVVDKSSSTYTFPYSEKVQNVIIDSDRALLGKINYDKPREWYVHQYYNAEEYKDRSEALVYGSRLRTDKSDQMLLDALEDDFYVIRNLAISLLDRVSKSKDSKMYEKLIAMAQGDADARVRAVALSALGDKYLTAEEYRNDVRLLLLKTIEEDSSYGAISSALSGLTKGTDEDIEKALSIAKTLETEESGALKAQLIQLYANYGDSSHLPFISSTLTDGSLTAYNLIGGLVNFTNVMKTQDIATQDKYFYVFEEIAKKGGAYANAILPVSLMQVKFAVSQNKSAAQEIIADNKDKTNSPLVQQAKVDVELSQQLIDKINKLIQ